MRVTIIVPAFTPASDVATATTPREFYRVDKLAKIVGDDLGIDVPVIEGTLADSPSTGFLLVFGLRADDDTRLGKRIVAFHEDRSTIMKRVETFQLAAAVEKHSYFIWSTEPNGEHGFGFVGRKDVASRIPARTLSGPFTSAHYAALDPDSADLIELLVRYLRAYDQAITIS